MPKQLYANNAKGRLNAGITNVATSLQLVGGQGALFPNPASGQWFMFTLIKSDGTIEVCKCTARSGDSFTTIVRAQEGTAAAAFNANDRVELRLTKGSMEWWRQQGHVESITGNVTLDVHDVGSTQVVTDGPAVVTLPAASALQDNDEICVKSMTEKKVTIVPGGTDTLDGDSSASPFQLPSFCSVKIRRIGGSAFVILERPLQNVGDAKFWPVNSGTAPKGYVFGEGGAISRTTYGGLYDVYGTLHGAGDGATTFTLPNFIGRSPIGSGSGSDAEAVDFSAVTTGSDQIAVASNTDRWKTGKKVQISTTGSLPAPLAAATDYFVIRVSSTAIKLATTALNALAGTAIDLTTQGTGTHTIAHALRTRAVGEKGGTVEHVQARAEVGPHQHSLRATNYQISINDTPGKVLREDFGMTPSLGDDGQGTGQAMDVQNPYIAGKWIIKT